VNYAPTEIGGEGRLKVPSFKIETYTVVISPSVGDSNRIVTLTSVAAFHGIRHHARVTFSDPAPEALGFVANVDQPNFNGHGVIAFLNLSDYADTYDVLRSEEPVSFFYRYTPSGFDARRPTRLLDSVAVGTGEEPLGEGPEDFSPEPPP